MSKASKVVGYSILGSVAAIIGLAALGSTIETETAGTPEPVIVTVQETQAPAPTAAPTTTAAPAPTTTAAPYVAPVPTEALVLLTWMDTGMYGEFFDAIEVSTAELDWGGSYDDAVAGCLQAWLPMYEIGTDVYDSSDVLWEALNDAGYSDEVSYLFAEAFQTYYNFVDYCSDGNVDATGVEMFNVAVEALEAFNAEVDRILYVGESA